MVKTSTSLDGTTQSVSKTGFRIEEKHLRNLKQTLDLIEEFKEEADLPFYDRQSVKDLTQYVVQNQDGVGFSLHKDDKVIGFIGGFFTQYLYDNTKYVLNEVLWFVTKEARGTKHSLKLLNLFLEAGKEADGITFTNQEQLNSSGLDLVLKRKGFRQMERNYIKVK